MRLSIIGTCGPIAIVVALLAGLAAGGAAAQKTATGPAGWNRDGAATYLDQRMNAWSARGKKLRTGQGQATCVSCHTALPYALARPSLRRAMHVRTPTPEEVRLLEDVVRRVDTYETHQPYYDSDDRKTVESRGTEAVLNALILASAAAERGQHDPAEPTRRAFHRLWETQRSDGAWDWLDFGLEPLESADAAYYGATLAAMAVGTVPASALGQSAEAAAGTKRLRAYLTERYASQNVFNRVSALLASTRWKDLLTRTQRETLIAEVRRAQQDDGGWSLHAMGGWRWSTTGWRAWRTSPPGTLDAALLAKSDGYATGLVVYTLRSAGLPVDDSAVAGGLRWLKAHQQNVQAGDRTYQAWRSYSLNRNREHGGDGGESWRRLFMSDAATAYAVLALVASE